MANAQGSRSRFGYVAEVTRGTTPVTPAIIELPITGHTLNPSIGSLEDDTIRSDRQIQDFRHGQKQGVGEIMANLRYGDYDALLEAVMMGTFTDDELKQGVTPKAFTFEDAMLDIAKYRVYKGGVIDTLKLTASPDQLVKASFGVVGSDMVGSTSALDASVTPATGNEPFDAFTGVITEGGVTIGTITSFTLNINNSVANTFAIGSQAAQGFDIGRGRVTGNIQAYVPDNTLLTKLLDEVESSIALTLTDPAGNSLEFNMPRIKYMTNSVPLNGEGSRIQSLDFQALRDDAEEVALIITRVPAV